MDRLEAAQAQTQSQVSGVIKLVNGKLDQADITHLQVIFDKYISPFLFLSLLP